MKLFVAIVWIVILTLVSLGYMSFVADHVNQKFALIVNVILFPILLGIIDAWIIQASLYMKLMLLLVIPITHVLYYGEDPVKPGLENLVTIMEAVFIWV